MASILVIDDDRAVLATIKVLLERAAHTIEAVDNSRDGLQTCSSSISSCREWTALKR
jgi:CheY-like chemotaxis protein